MIAEEGKAGDLPSCQIVGAAGSAELCTSARKFAQSTSLRETNTPRSGWTYQRFSLDGDFGPPNLLTGPR
jgi:hypothetical protein